MNMKPKYGTLEYYQQYFEDIIADVGDGNQDGFQHALLMMQAFRNAIESWLDYHKEAVTSYEYLLDEFLDNRQQTSVEELDQQAEKLPQIPDFPSIFK